MNAPLTLLIVGPEHADLPTQLESLRLQGALVAHCAGAERALLGLATLLPDLLLAAPEAQPALAAATDGRRPRLLDWDGEPASLNGLLAPYLPQLQPRPGPRRLGQLQVDERLGTVQHPAAPGGPLQVHMPATELRLLLCLGRHSGRAVSRQQLLSEVWPADQRPQARSVDQVVRRLRQLLQPLGLAGQLRSLRGLGYRLDLDPHSRVS